MKNQSSLTIQNRRMVIGSIIIHWLFVVSQYSFAALPPDLYGSPTAIVEELAPNSTTKQVYTADLDGDGDEDIVAYWRSFKRENKPRIVWYENRLLEDEGDFSNPRSVLQAPSHAFFLDILSILDLDQDGDLDILCDNRIAENRLSEG